MPPSAVLSTLGERLRKARLEADLSQAQLGAPHFTRAHISAIEMGKVRPAVRSLEFLAGKLGKPIGYFLGEDEASLRERDHSLVRKALRLIQGGDHEGAARTLRRVLETKTRP